MEKIDDSKAGVKLNLTTLKRKQQNLQSLK